MESTSTTSFASSSKRTFMPASPEMALAVPHTLGSPAQSTRYASSEPTMDCSPAAAGPPKNMASLLSPPPSPPNRAVLVRSSPTPVSLTDPAMYAQSRSSSAAPVYAQSNHFDITAPVQIPRIVVGAPEKPKKEEYAIFVSAVYELYNQDPKAWWKQESRYLAGIGSHYSGNNRVQKSTPSAPKPRAIAPAPRPSSGSGVAAPKPRPRTQRTPRATPKVLALDAYDGSLISPPNFKLSAKPKAPVSREDVDFDSIPDYCPPLSTLPPGNTKCLKTEWKGQALNLDSDPHRHLLHPAEVQLAATLRLSCASYLTSKRRIFQEKVTRTQNGMEFRKTDSQKACKIDVNKASKLWASFDKVGWFDIKYIKQYL